MKVPTKSLELRGEDDDIVSVDLGEQRMAYLPTASVDSPGSNDSPGSDDLVEGDRPFRDPTLE